MRKLNLILALLLLVSSLASAQTDIPNTTSGGPTGQGSWLRFLSGGSNNSTGIQENYGLNITGTGIQPVKIYNASFLVGYTSSGTDYGTGNAYISGNVGIGTLAPSAKLDVNGSISSNAESHFSTGAFSDPVQYTAFAVKVGSGGIAVKGNSVFTDQVAIGTTDAKGYKLAVNGSAIATSITVKANANWPDYVFKPKYSLAKLEDVKAYIDQHHHLPEVPSATEMEEKGQDLGEMNRVLLKKVEELTLYMIEIKRENAKLKTAHQKQLNALKRQVRQLSSKR